MARVKNSRPTTIYWLIDVRPETLATYPNGKPFYCGKTVTRPSIRLSAHWTATTNHPERAISVRLRECKDNVRIDVVDILPAHHDWCAWEKFWIATLRHLHPDCVNVSSGGQGALGMVHSASTRAKIRVASTGKIHSAETRARISKLAKERERSPHSTETRIKMSVAATGRKRGKFSDEWIARLGASKKGVLKSAEHRAKIAAAKTGKKRAPFSEEWRANMRAARARYLESKTATDAHS